MLRLEHVSSKPYHLKLTLENWAILDQIKKESGQSYKFIMNELIREYASHNPSSGIEYKKLKFNPDRYYILYLTPQNWDYLSLLKNKNESTTYVFWLNKVIEDYATRVGISNKGSQKAKRVKR